MRLIPSDLNEADTTTSEARVHRALSGCSIDGVALHSVGLPEHKYKVCGEIDFLVVLERALIVVEVKGAGVSCRNGVWTYSDRRGHLRTSSEGPFKQASSAMFALRDRLIAQFGIDLANVPIGFLVVTTDVDLPPSVEWASETYCGRGLFNRDFAGALRRAEQYWASKNRTADRISKPMMQRLLEVLRPDFDRSPLLDARAEALDAAFVKLTAEQYDRLDFALAAPRVICEGGAGTGKTLLAMEVARREAARGRRVALVCRSRRLAMHLEAELRPHSVLVIQPGQRLAEPVEHLVIDEGQDLMTFGHIEELGSWVVGGLESGSWTIFMDPNQQADLYGDFDSDALEWVRSLAVLSGPLTRNCRNTRTIAFQTRAHTGADVGVASAGDGPEVQFVACDDSADEASKLDEHIRGLLTQDVSARDITVLSLTGDWETSAIQMSRLHRRSRIWRMDGPRAESISSSSVAWSSVVDFKGLESRFICVIDINSLADEQAVRLLYVALSRARIGLWIGVNPLAKARLSDLFKAHALDARAALGER